MVRILLGLVIFKNMCRVYYLGTEFKTDVEKPHTPPRDRFHPLDPKEWFESDYVPVAALKSYPFLTLLNSGQGCGCAFVS